MYLFVEKLQQRVVGLFERVGLLHVQLHKRCAVCLRRALCVQLFGEWLVPEGGLWQRDPVPAKSDDESTG